MAQSKTAFVAQINDQKDYQRLVDPSTQSLGMKSGRVYLEPGQACGRHNTDDREEILVFLAGSGILEIGGSQDLEVGQGKVAYIPPRTLHDVKNNSKGPLVYVFCVTPVQG